MTSDAALASDIALVIYLGLFAILPKTFIFMFLLFNHYQSILHTLELDVI